ncbi:glycosyltransferase family 2 protein [Gehongia tenuis]|uniref:Glycosyltransferase family 2 protein n=1 Tax=Gehongia tenuis TaxID=2763655 RepID=A0A926D3I1_9FIRM|nr:glycosyltransferase [Gehongia tenuis]MBC8530682.1 glycosyltransferase family 2 protein [Gehongia tenuis]
MEAIKIFLAAVEIFFVLYLLGYSTFLFLSVFQGSSTLYQNRRREQLENSIHHDFYIPVSILVPAHNEEVTIVDTVSTLLEQDYPLFEIVVVDDGSDDGTAARLIEAFDIHPSARPVHRVVPSAREKAVYETDVRGTHITLVVKEQGGKADALNMGINMSAYPYFLCIDADSMLQRDSLRRITQPILEDDRVIACGGQVRVSNSVKIRDGRVADYSLPKNLLIAMQVLEYDRSFLASRIFMDNFNGNLIISGAFGLFRKETVVLAGGYALDTMGEDMELVVKLHAFCRTNHIDYRMRYVPEAVCWSQAPGSLKDLAKQRRRWHIGLFESLWHYRRSVGKKEYGLMGSVSFLYFWLYELLSPYIELFGLLTIVLAFLVNLINVPFMLLFFAVYAIYGCTLTLIAFFSRIHTQQLTLSFKDSVKAVLLSVFELFGMRFVLMLIRTNALIGYRKKRNVWGKLERYKHDQKSTGM